jgi:hypothetical protein
LGDGCWSFCLGALWEVIPNNPEEHNECNLPDLYETEPLPLAYWDGLFYALTAEIRCGAVDNPLDTFSASLRWGPLELSGAVGDTHLSVMATETLTSDRTTEMPTTTARLRYQPAIALKMILVSYLALHQSSPTETFHRSRFGIVKLKLVGG